MKTLKLILFLSQLILNAGDIQNIFITNKTTKYTTDYFKYQYNTTTKKNIFICLETDYIQNDINTLDKIEFTDIRNKFMPIDKASETKITGNFINNNSNYTNEIERVIIHPKNEKYTIHYKLNNEDKIFELKFNEYTTVIFKQYFENTIKYLFVTNPQYSDRANIFQNSRNRIPNTASKIEIFKVYENTADPKKLFKSIYGICYNNGYIETFDFGTTDLNINNAKYAFRSSTIKKLIGLDKIFNGNLQSANYMFAKTNNLQSINLSNLTMPTDCTNMFVQSKITDVNFNNTKFQENEYTNLHCTFTESNVDNLDFSTVQNTNYIELNKTFTGCQNLKSLTLGNLIKDNCIIHFPFINTDNLKTIDISNATFKKYDFKQTLNIFNERNIKTKTEIILPKDKTSSEICLNSIKNTIKNSKMKNDDIKAEIKIDDTHYFKYITPTEDTQNDHNQQNNRKKGKFGKPNNNSCCRNCCCCCK